MKTLAFVCIVLYIFTVSCTLRKTSYKSNLSLMDSIKNVSDSITVDKITIHNLFKSQMLAHSKNGQYDSLMITKNVYYAHKQLWDSCYGTIFGEKNAIKFNNPSGMVSWNKTLYPENKALFDKKVRQLLSMNLDSILKNNLKKFNKLVSYKPKATISILFTPIQGIGFGGCNAEQFALELNYENNDLDYIINKGLPHELNHLAYEPYRIKDPNQNTALAQTIDEGLACYFTWIFFDKKIPKHEIVEHMSEADWNWYVTNEKEIFQKVSPYFNDKTGDNPLLRNDKFKLFPNAPKTLFYWLGFRIVEAYVEKHGLNSWKEIYKTPIVDVLKHSGYEEQLRGGSLK